VGITKSSRSIGRWFYENTRRLLVVQILALLFGLFGFVLLGRAGMIDTWSFDRAALLIGGLTIVASGRIAAGQLARKRREIRRRAEEEGVAAGTSGRVAAGSSGRVAAGSSGRPPAQQSGGSPPPGSGDPA
jgi:hypothetical protein